jgi:chromosome segregation ATPase
VKGSWDWTEGKSCSAAFGGIGLIVGIVALVIAIGAKNDAGDDQTVQDQAAQSLEAQLTEKANKLEAKLAADTNQTSSVEQAAQKANKKGNKAQKTGAAAGKQAAANKAEIDRLKQSNEQLTKEVDQLKAEQKQTQQKLLNLQVKVNQKKNK